MTISTFDKYKQINKNKQEENETKKTQPWSLKRILEKKKEKRKEKRREEKN